MTCCSRRRSTVDYLQQLYGLQGNCFPKIGHKEKPETDGMGAKVTHLLTPCYGPSVLIIYVGQHLTKASLCVVHAESTDT